LIADAGGNRHLNSKGAIRLRYMLFATLADAEDKLQSSNVKLYSKSAATADVFRADRLT